ncbi:CYIR protein, partial [Plasmodium cynomolgi strain B]
MSYPCKTSFKGYLSYKCYENIKIQFGEKIERTNYSIKEGISKYAETYTSNNEPKLKMLSNIFTNLKKYLSNDHVFASGDYDGEGTCKYISYLLCDQIRDKLHGECDKATFNIFQDFVDKYNESTNSHLCKDNIKHLDVNEFLKMKALYELYDNYIYLIPSYAFRSTHYCNNMLNLVRLYNNFLNKYPSDSLKFNDVLKQFEELMDTITETGKKHCKEQYIYIRKPDFFIAPVEEIAPHANTLSGRESNLLQKGTLDSEVKPKSPEVISSSTTSVEEQKIEVLENSKRSEVSNILEVASTSVSKGTVERRPLNQNRKHSEQHEILRRYPYNSRGLYVPGSYDGQGRYPKTNKILSREGNSIVITEAFEPGSGNDSAGFMSNVQNGISELIKDIDP